MEPFHRVRRGDESTSLCLHSRNSVLQNRHLGHELSARDSFGDGVRETCAVSSFPTPSLKMRFHFEQATLTNHAMIRNRRTECTFLKWAWYLCLIWLHIRAFLRLNDCGLIF